MVSNPIPERLDVYNLGERRIRSGLILAILRRAVVTGIIYWLGRGRRRCLRFRSLPQNWQTEAPFKSPQQVPQVFPNMSPQPSQQPANLRMTRSLLLRAAVTTVSPAVTGRP